MRNDERHVFAAAVPAAREAASGGRNARYSQRMSGIDGRLRPYRDVRAAFEPWRRLALAAWVKRDEARAIH